MKFEEQNTNQTTSAPVKKREIPVRSGVRAGELQCAAIPIDKYSFDWCCQDSASGESSCQTIKVWDPSDW